MAETEVSEMLYIVWNESNNLGIPIIDEQHRGIVTIINSLHHCILEGRGKSAMKPVLAMLEQYTVIHFDNEERLMEEAGYPELDAHAALHRDLSVKTKGFLSQQQDPQEILKFLREWWLGHINSEDRKYASLVRKKMYDTDAR